MKRRTFLGAAGAALALPFLASAEGARTLKLGIIGTGMRGQVHLAGNGLARFPLAALQALQNQRLDLLVERAEGRGGAVNNGRSGGRGYGGHGSWGK